MNVNMGAIEFEISRLQKANADLRAQLQQERAGREKLAEALENIFFVADTAQQLGGGNSFTRAIRKVAAAALAQTEATP